MNIKKISLLRSDCFLYLVIVFSTVGCFEASSGKGVQQAPIQKRTCKAFLADYFTPSVNFGADSSEYDTLPDIDKQFHQFLMRFFVMMRD